MNKVIWPFAWNQLLWPCDLSQDKAICPTSESEFTFSGSHLRQIWKKSQAPQTRKRKSLLGWVKYLAEKC